MARRAILAIEPALLVKLLRGHPMSEVTSDVPADLVIVGNHRDEMRVNPPLELLVKSATFDDVADGCLLTLWAPTFTGRISELDALYQILRPTP